MKHSWLLILILFICSCKPRVINQSHTGIEFSRDGVLWQQEPISEQGQFWLRKNITINEKLDSTILYGLGISMLASSEIYWDSVLIGENGKVGKNDVPEKAGKVYKIFPLDYSKVATGTHELSVIYSNFSSSPFRIYDLSIKEYNYALLAPAIFTSFVHIYAGLFLIIGLFYLVRYVADFSITTSLFFALLCLSFFALILIEYSRTYYFYQYPFHFIRLKLILSITCFISIIMPLFFLFRFNNRKKITWLIFCVFAISPFFFLTHYGYDFATNMTMVVGFFMSSLIGLGAVIKKHKGSRLLFLTILPISFLLYFNPRFYDLLLYICFGFLILVNLISLAIQDRNNRKEIQEAKLVSSRLQLQLLKKNIQPHFINNSITSAIDWIERNPQKGVELLFALSNEFDILNDISERKLIPIIKEIELCKSHLKIMSFRKEEFYEFHCENINDHDLIPPAVLLTIVENGISHKKDEAGSLNFFLESNSNKSHITYHLIAKGSFHKTGKLPMPGTGTRYIKARLQESFPDKWTFESYDIEDGWENKITLPLI